MTDPREIPATERRIRRLFTTRKGGYSVAPYAGFNLGDHVGDDPDAVARNRQHLAELINLPLERLVFMEQLHTTEVAVVTGPVTEPVEATDALVTTEPDLALVVLTADCVPVLCADEKNGVLAAAHAGRHGARNGIMSATLDAMLDLGAELDHIHVLMGAAASGERYELPAAMAADLEQRLPGSLTTTLQGTPGIDLRAGLAREVISRGVMGVHIHPVCTIESLNHFSYRREGTTGRQAGVVYLDSRRGRS